MKSASTHLVPLAIVAALTASSHAAPITWGSATTVAADTDVSTIGVFKYAEHWGGTNTTINTVTFSAAQNNVFASGTVGVNGNIGNPSTVGLSSAYLGILRFNWYQANGQTATMKNLTSGHQYQSQVWVADGRYGVTQNTKITDGPNLLIKQGQYANGTFIADATSQSIAFGSGDGIVNAIQVRDISASWSGTTNGTWANSDTTSSNFSGLNFTAAKAQSSVAVFGDTTTAGGAVSNYSLTVGAGGASTGTVLFENTTAQSYTIGSADSNGITGATALNKTGNGTVTLTGTNTYTGNTTISSGTLQIGSGGATGSLYTPTVLNGNLTFGSASSIVNNGALVYNIAGGSVNVNRTISGTGTVSVTGNQAVNFSNGTTINTTGSQTYSATATGTRYYGFTLTDNATVALTSSAGNISMTGMLGTAGGNTGNLNINTSAGNGNVTLDVAVGQNSVNYGLNSLNVTAGTGTISLGIFNTDKSWDTALNTISLSGGAVNSTVNMTAFGTLNVTNSLASAFSGTLSGSGAFTKNGAGTLTLSNTNSYSGGTTISGGTLTLGHATDTLANGGAVNVNGGTLALGTNTDTVGAVTLTSGSITSTGTGRLTGTVSAFDVRSGTISAKLGGTVGLTKTTGGTVTISSDNSSGGYTGATLVSAGTLVIDGNISTSITTVSGGTLGGIGTVGATDVQAGGTLAPGNSIGTLNFTNTLSLAGISNFEINPLLSLGLNADRANVTNGITYGGTLNVLYGGSSSNFANGMIFNLFDASSFSGSFTTVNLPTLDDGLMWQNNLLSNGTLTVIPEPNVAALLGGFGVLTLLRRRR